MMRIFIHCGVLLLFCLLVMGAPLTGAQERVPITWFLGLGTGGNWEQMDVQMAVVEAFNASQTRIQLDVQYANSLTGQEVLETLIASGTPPDIVGPVSLGRAEFLQGQWLDLQPVIDQVGYDLSDFDPRVLNFYRRNEDGLFGLPMFMYPSLLFFNPDLFRDLPTPPQEWGARYRDGREWTIETLTDVARQLTLDANGESATSPQFDPDQIVQQGLFAQWHDVRGQATLFGAGSFIDKTGAAVIPDHWRAALHWMYDGMWRDHFIVNRNQVAPSGDSHLFRAGVAAMDYSHVWMIPILDNDWQEDTAPPRWDVAALPSYDGQITAKLHSDSFGILATSPHPAEALEVLATLFGEAAPQLLPAYGGIPVRRSFQPAYFAQVEKDFSIDVNWQVVLDSLDYVDVPNHESYLPNHQAAQTRLQAFLEAYQTMPALDLDAELNQLRADLAVIFDAEKLP